MLNVPGWCTGSYKILSLCSSFSVRDQFETNVKQEGKLKYCKI